MDEAARLERLACALWPAVITGGHAEGHADGFYRVPKRELLAGLQVMLQSGELRRGRRGRRWCGS